MDNDSSVTPLENINVYIITSLEGMASKGEKNASYGLITQEKSLPSLTKKLANSTYWSMSWWEWLKNLIKEYTSKLILHGRKRTNAVLTW